MRFISRHFVLDIVAKIFSHLVTVLRCYLYCQHTVDLGGQVAKRQQDCYYFLSPRLTFKRFCVTYDVWERLSAVITLPVGVRNI